MEYQNHLETTQFYVFFSSLTKPEKLLSFWHCGIYTEQDKEIELTFMESLPCVGMYWGLLNGILLIIRAIL